MLEEEYRSELRRLAAELARVRPNLRAGDQLSGGERTLAAMALLFALQAYQRPPFLVLDEIDAYLDPRNVQALSRYMQQVECQTIVISLKDRLFSRGQGLVSISKDKSRGASVVLSLDLDRVRQATARRAGAAPLPPAPVAAG